MTRRPTVAALTVVSAIATLVILMGPAAMPANGQTVQCAPMGAVADGLANSHGETRQVWGLVSGGAGLVIHANLDTGTWTLLAVTGGEACLVAAGENYTRVDAPPGIEG
jgi:hypothetical protein